MLPKKEGDERIPEVIDERLSFIDGEIYFTPIEIKYQIISETFSWYITF